MIIGALLLLAFATVPLLGGRLGRLQLLRLRFVRVAVAMFAVQILIVNVIPGGNEDLYSAVHIATYAVLGGVMLANLAVPGVPLIALGGLSNTLAIVANGGVMPASEGALRLAGMTADPDVFTNSGLVANAKLQFLGDVFAVPAWVPAANVFSVGDLLLIAGGWVLVHRVCGSRLPWRRRRGPAVVLFDAAGVVEAATPEARRVLGRMGGDDAIGSVAGVALPPEAFVVAGRARAAARGGTAPSAEAHVLDTRGRPLTLTASALNGGPRVAVAIRG